MKAFFLIALANLVLAEKAWAAGSEFSVWPYVNLLILIGALFYFLRKPIKTSMASRHEEVKRTIEEAEAMRLEAESLLANYQTRLNQLDQEVSKILAEARSHGEREKNEILLRAKKLAAQIRSDAERSIQKEIAQAKDRIRREAMMQAADEAKRLLEIQMNERIHDQITDSFIQRLENSNGTAQ